MEARINRVELKNNELELVNGGSETIVIDLKNDPRYVLGTVPTRRNRDKSLREMQLEQNPSANFDW